MGTGLGEKPHMVALSASEQRRFLNMLRFLGNDQLARRLGEHYLPLWEDDVGFSRLIQTLIAAMALEQRSGLTVASLRTILKVTGGVTSRMFVMIKSLAIDAIETGKERITDEAVHA
ncbi:hypothetical protein [Ruegeria sp. ANG-R]|uniref:hypothetical protein n=1 Tax=Ruegeria sp. ANG-R TaxID=1577903 RepID=UPI00187C9C3D|nr:hypothetical protein [Ruegeria sp. ANG-R]